MVNKKKGERPRPDLPRATIRDVKPKFQGPTRPLTDVQKFRRTGIVSRRTGGPGPRPDLPRATIKDIDQRKRAAEKAAKAVAKIAEQSRQQKIIRQKAFFKMQKERKQLKIKRAREGIKKAQRLARLPRAKISKLTPPKRISFRRPQIDRPVPIKKTPRLREIIDIISRGDLTQRNIDKQQESLNNQVQKFNERFSGKQLSPNAFKDAQKKKVLIDKIQDKINKDQQKLFGTKRFKALEFTRLVKKKPLTKEQVIQEVKRIERDINKLEIKRRGAGAISKRKTNLLIKSKRKSLSDVKTGVKPKVFATDLPIIPASQIPKGIQFIKFVGTQKRGAGGKIITDVFFTTKAGRAGIARGVAVERKGNIASVVAGRSGKVRVRLPSGKKKITGLESFVGREKAKVEIVQEITSKFRFGKGKRDVIRVTQQNLDFLVQRGVGQVASVRGKKFFFPQLRSTGKLIKKKKKRISLKDFASISAVFTKKDLSLIIGETITREKSRAKFIGLIKGGNRATTTGKGKVVLSTIEKKQFAKALDQVLSKTAASLPKVTGPRVTRKEALLAAARLTTQKIRVKAPTKKVISTVKPTIAKQKAKQLTTQLSSQRSKQKVLQKQIQKAKQKIAQATTPRTAQQQRQVQKLRLGLKTLQVQKQVQQAKLKALSFRVGRFKGLVVAAKGRRRVRRPVKRKVIPQAFNVFARPLKKRKSSKRPKLIKVNRVPLTKAQAEGLRDHIVDNSLPRTGSIRPTKGKPRSSSFKIPTRSIAKKFRSFRKVRGRKVPLPKGRVIEKKKFIGDTQGEIQGLNIRQALSRLPRASPQRKKKRKVTGAQRTVLLQRLKKARAVRMSNLRRKK